MEIPGPSVHVSELEQPQPDKKNDKIIKEETEEIIGEDVKNKNSSRKSKTKENSMEASSDEIEVIPDNITFTQSLKITSTGTSTSQSTLTTQEFDTTLHSMKLEMLNKTPNIDSLKIYMSMSFSERRQLIEDNKIPTNKLLQMFPSLNLYEIIRHEYTSVTKWDINKLIEKIEHVIDKLLEPKYCKFLAEKNSLVKASLKDFLDSKLVKHSCEWKKLRRNLGMVLICTKYMDYFHQGIFFKVVNQTYNPATDVPSILPFCVIVNRKKGTKFQLMNIYVKRIKFTTTDNFFDTVLTLYMLYWILCLNYEDKIKPLFEKFDSWVKKTS